MKCTITIETSDYTDLRVLVGMIIALPAPIAVVPAPVNPETVTVTLKDPDTGESHVITRRQKDSGPPATKLTPPPAFGTMLTPMGPMPVVKETPLPSSSPKQGEERRCEGCQQAFTPKQKNSKYCSDKCSQKAYTQAYFAKKNKEKPEAQVLKQAKSHQKPGEVNREVDFEIFDINGKQTQVFGSPEKLKNFSARLVQQEEDRKRVHKKYKPGNEHPDHTD